MSQIKWITFLLCFVIIALSAVSEGKDKTENKPEANEMQGSLTYYYFDG